MKRIRKEFGLVSWALDHKKIAYLLVAVLVGVGIIGLFRMNRDEFPPFEIKFGLVAGVYPGASAEEVKTQLTGPLEKVLFSIPEVNRKTVKSFSRDGMCFLYVDTSTDPVEKDMSWSIIRHRLDAAKLTLPVGAQVVVLDSYSETSALLISMESEDKGYSELLGYAEDLCARLRKLPNLSSASVLGAQQEEIAVTVDMDRLTAYGISPAKLMLDFQTSAAGASFGTSDNGGSKSMVHVSRTVTDEQEVEDRIVYADASGSALRLKDIATVDRRYKTPAPYVSYNGHSALIVNVVMSPDQNIVAFGKDVEKVFSEFREDLPESVKLNRITDQPKVVERSVLSFLRDLLISMLVVIFVMLMLFPMRSALIAGSGVPVCTAVAVAVMYATGMQLNNVSLGALIVVLGMIVDDSIITMDGYMNKLGRGLDRRTAALESSRELFKPMLIATLAISLMFFPTKLIITGYLGDFISFFPWIIAISLGFSLVYAMLVVPSLEVRFITSPDVGGRNLLSRTQSRFFSAMQRIYDKCEAFCFKHSSLTIGAGIIAIVLGLLMFSRINIQMMPKLARDCFAVEVILDDNSSLDRTSQVVDSLSKVISADASRIESVTAFVGQNAPRFHSAYSPILPADNVAQLIVNTKSNKATVEVLSELEARCEHLFPDAVIRFKQMDYEPSGSVAVMFKGAPQEELKPFADSLRRFMLGMDDMLKWVHGDCDASVAGVEVAINQDEASRYGVNRASLALSLRGLFSGTTLATITEADGKRIPVNLYCRQNGEPVEYSDLESVLVPTVLPGESVPLSQVASVVPKWSYANYPRYAGEDCLSVYADMRMGCSQPAAMKQITEYIDRSIRPNLPEGVEVRYGGLNETNDIVFPQIAWSFLVAVLVLFLALLIHFKKIGVAVLTMVLSMLCLFGASFGLWVFNMDFTITAVLGLISLVGIIVRNGIIMFEYAEELRFVQGKSVYEAAMLAGQRRMRPIFLTSCTTALGVLPMILSGDLMWMPMGIVIAFGTMLSIVLIVLVMPVSYWLVFRKADSESSGNRPKPAVPVAAVAGLCILLAPDVSAQDGATSVPREWTLEQCIEMSASNDPYLKNSRLDVSSAKAMKQEVVWVCFPKVEVVGLGYHAINPLLRMTVTDILGTGDAAWNISNAVDDFAAVNGLKSEFVAMNKGYSAMATAIQPLYAGGRIASGSRLASLGVQAAELQEQLKLRDTRLEVEKQYWQVVSLQEKKKILDSGMHLLDTLHKNVLSARQAGLVLESDLTAVEHKKKELMAEAVKLRGGLRLLKLNIFNSIGVDCPFFELDSLTFTDCLELPDDAFESVDMEETEAVPVESELLGAKLEAARLQKKMALGEYLPQVGLGFSYGYNDIMGTTTSGGSFNGVAFLAVTVPITDLGKMPSRARRLENEVQKARNEKEYLDAQLALRRQKNMLELETAYEEAIVARDALSSAKDAESRLRADYNAGLATIMELLEAELSVRTAHGEYIDKCITYYTSRSAFQLYD